MNVHEAEILQTLSLFNAPDSIFEIRLPKAKLNGARPSTASGYFDDLSVAAKAVATVNQKAPGVYVTLNPVNPALLARAANRVAPYAESTTADSDILCRRWLLIDADPVRPAGISSSHDEHQSALDRCGQIRSWLTEQGWPMPVYADSGNGGHLLYRIDLPNDADSKTLIQNTLAALASRFDDDAVKIDTGVFNAARISKVYGTVAAKGDPTDDRPHRVSRLLTVPEPVEIVPVDLLQELAATLPAPAVPIRPIGTAQSNSPASAKKSDFFWNVNQAALANLSAWVPVLYPDAKPYRNGYRVKSRNLHRDCEEDLSIQQDGIKDFGVHDQGDPQQGKRTPIDLVMAAHGDMPKNAAFWLCDQLSVQPKALGWKDTDSRSRKKTLEPPPKAPEGENAPVITVERGALAVMLEQAEQALIDHCPDLYQRAGMLTRTARITQELQEHGFTRPAGSLTLIPVTTDFLLWRMNQVIQWQKMTMDGPRRVDAPRSLAAMLLDLAGHWRFPYLTGVVESPTLRRDGTVLIRPGYDPASGLFLDSGGMEFDPIPDRPTKVQAERALDDLRDVIKDFPYEAPQDRAVALSGILTVAVRHRLNTAPLHAFSATRPGSGKSFQADIPALIATGRTAPAMSQATDETEEEKRLMGILLSAVPLVLIDNINRPLGSDRLCSVLTQQTYKGRVLGLNKNPELPCRLTWFATGNALTLMDDLNDRAIMGFLNPPTERPEQQVFDRDLYSWIPQQRARLASAVITVLRHYVVMNFPDPGLTPFVRFNDWSRLIRNALVYLGETDPVLTQERLRDRDPIRTGLGALLECWYDTFKNQPMLVSEVAGTETRELKAVLQEVASKDGDKINTRLLSHYLRKYTGRAENGLRLVLKGKDGHSKLALWRVETTKNFRSIKSNTANAANTAPSPLSKSENCGISGISGIKNNQVENFPAHREPENNERGEQSDSPLATRILTLLRGQPAGFDTDEITRQCGNGKGASPALVGMTLLHLAKAGDVGRVNDRWVAMP